GDLLLPPYLTRLRKNQARRERVGAGLPRQGQSAEPRRHHAREQEGRERARLREPRARRPVRGREDSVETGGPRRRDGGRPEGDRGDPQEIEITTGGGRAKARPYGPGEDRGPS